jgi:glutamyl-Q tRNA(Asp) synthetase
VPTPRYLHVPVVRNAAGEKLSKQTGALAVQPGDAAAAIDALMDAARFLGLHVERPDSIARFWQAAVPAWASLLAAREGGALIPG